MKDIGNIPIEIESKIKEYIFDSIVEINHLQHKVRLEDSESLNNYYSSIQTYLDDCNSAFSKARDLLQIYGGAFAVYDYLGDRLVHFQDKDFQPPGFDKFLPHENLDINRYDIQERTPTVEQIINWKHNRKYEQIVNLIFLNARQKEGSSEFLEINEKKLTSAIENQNNCIFCEDGEMGAVIFFYRLLQAYVNLKYTDIDKFLYDLKKKYIYYDYKVTFPPSHEEFDQDLERLRFLRQRFWQDIDKKYNNRYTEDQRDDLLMGFDLASGRSGSSLTILNEQDYYSEFFDQGLIKKSIFSYKENLEKMSMEVIRSSSNIELTERYINLCRFIIRQINADENDRIEFLRNNKDKSSIVSFAFKDIDNPKIFQDILKVVDSNLVSISVADFEAQIHFIATILFKSNSNFITDFHGKTWEFVEKHFQKSFIRFPIAPYTNWRMLKVNKCPNQTSLAHLVLPILSSNTLGKGRDNYDLGFLLLAIRDTYDDDNGNPIYLREHPELFNKIVIWIKTLFKPLFHPLMDEIYYNGVKKKEEDARDKAAIKSAFAEVNARTTSHNTGSHILTNDLTKEGGAALKKFQIYLRQRMLYNSDVTSDVASFEIEYSIIDIITEFESLEIVKEYISGVKGCTFKKINASEAVGKEKVSIPNGVLGFQALYLIFENLIRNFFKHGNLEHTTKLEILIEKKEETNDHICLAISDASKPSDKQFERISKLVKDSILDNNKKLRSKGLGFLEMKGAACYLNKIPIENIDDYEIKINGIEQKVFAVEINKSKKLQFILWLRKPKNVLIYTDKQIENEVELNKKGIYLKADIENENEPHQWIIVDKSDLLVTLSKTKASISPRIFLTKENVNNNYPVLSQADFKAILDKAESAITFLYEKWSEHLRGKKNLLNNQIIVLTDQRGNYKEKNDLCLWKDQSGKSQKIIFDDHANDFNNNINEFYYEPYSAARGFGSLLSSYDQLEKEHKKYLKHEIFECSTATVGIIDERIQRSLTESFTMQSAYKNNQIFQRMNIYIPDNNKGEVNLNAETFTPEIEKKICEWINNINVNLDYLIIHLGIVEKFLHVEKDESDVEKWVMQNISPNLQKGNNTSIIFTSDRGTPDNIPKEYRFIHYSNIVKYLLEETSKYHFMRILISSRKTS